MSTGKLVLAIVGAVLALVGLGTAVGGGVLLWADETQRDADGFFTSPTYALGSATYAITTEDLTLEAHPAAWFPAEGDLTFRITAEPTVEKAVFIGIADQAALDAYLDGVSHDRIRRLGDESDEVAFDSRSGGAPPAVPGDADLWVASVSGTGVQTLTWDAEPGRWGLAIMNADGSIDLSVDTSAGVHIGLLGPIGIGLLIGGLVALALGIALVLLGALGGASPNSTPESVAAPVEGVHPVRLVGRLDPDLSRWQWLVKWLLALPHVLVLALLWSAFVVLTVVAGFSILFTRRYPRAIFDFNVGVLRWTWRVTFYAYGALGTDRYPPFTLDPDPTYPADLSVAYPDELSRGLVLVKWWLLAIPHYIIVGLLTGGLISWTTDIGGEGGAQAVTSGGVIGLLVFVAAIVLAFSGRYPRAIYDVVLGLQRWVYRVIAYAALMTDVYPPFRLDAGGDEPTPASPPPSSPPPADAGADPALTHH